MRLAINGFGRIGRVLTRCYFSNPQFRDQLELVAVNDMRPPKDHALLLKRDSLHGTMNEDVSYDDSSITVGGKTIKTFSERDPSALPWKDLGVDVVLECTGKFRDKTSASTHLSAGAKKVMISAPGGKDIDATFVMGVNHESYNPDEHHIISNASCTTNCLAPMAKVVHERFGIRKGLMTTIHSYTSDQRLLDNTHSDPRRARAAAINMVPTTTGAARAVGLVIPELKGKLDGFAIRVPTPNVSLTDLVAELDKEVTREEVNAALKQASEAELKGVLELCEEELVSSDFMGSPFSSVVDAPLTTVIDENNGKGRMVKLCSWYDNEAGFSNRMLDLCLHMRKSL